MNDSENGSAGNLQALLDQAEAGLRLSPQEALHLSDQALKLARSEKLPSGVAASYMMIGRALRMKNMLPEALEYFLLAAHQYEQLDDTRGVCLAHIRLGSLYARLERFESAMGQLALAGRLAEELNDACLRAKTLQHMGGAEMRNGHYDKARAHLEEARELFRQTDDEKAVMYATLKLGEIHSQLEQWPDALRELDLVRTTAERENWPYLLARSEIRMGCAYGRAGDHDRGYKMLALGLTTARRIGVDELVLTAFDALARYFLQRGDSKQSLEYTRKYSHLQKQLMRAAESERFDAVLQDVRQRGQQNTDAFDETDRRQVVGCGEMTGGDRLLDAYEELRAQGEKLNAVFNNAVVGINIIDRFGQYRFINDYWAKMLGYTVDEVHHLKNLKVTHPDDAAESFQRFLDMIEGRVDHYTTRQRYVRKDGESFWAILYASSIHDSTGAVEAYVGVIVDIDELVRKEEALRELQRQNAALALAVTANHEINQPLQLLRSNLEMVEMLSPELLDAASRKYVQRMHEAIDRIAEILEAFRLSKSVRFDEYIENTEMAVLDQVDPT